ncbi:peptide transporter, partial [Salmonella enterica subsp. enterica serovar Onderstepoort]|nr:peptide transporter [Salmonella enterica subsp. enterica serovar Onderstepoort]
SLAEWSEDEIRMLSLPAQPEKPAQPAADSDTPMQQVKKNIQAFFPE